MIVCNGCSKSGTHLLTSIVKHLGKHQVGGSLIYRKKDKSIKSTGLLSAKTILEKSSDYFVHAHIKCDQNSIAVLKKHGHVFVVRHPRDVAISWMRHRNKENPSITLSTETLAELIKCGMFGTSVPNYYRLFSPSYSRFGLKMLADVA